jgi:hypothetical protein
MMNDEITIIKVTRLPTCEVGVPDGYGDVCPCGEPSAVILNFDDKSSLNVCKEHFEKMSENEYVDFE